jgi:phytoene synthase
VLAEFRETARVALKSARAHVAALPREVRKAFLPLALVDPYLSALRRVDPLRQVAEINPLYRLWRLSTCRFPPSA